MSDADTSISFTEWAGQPCEENPVHLGNMMTAHNSGVVLLYHAFLVSCKRHLRQGATRRT